MLTFHRSARCHPLHPASSHKEKTISAVWWFKAFYMKGTQVQQTHGKHKLLKQRTETVRQVSGAIWRTDSFAKQMLLLACQVRGQAQQGRISHSSYKQVTFLSDLDCVTAKLDELYPSASVQRTSEYSLFLGLWEEI